MLGASSQGIVILGMHRGGTSALAGTVARLGAALPRTPLPAAADNPSGFHESLPIVKVNHALLLVAKCAWDVCLSFDPEPLGARLTPEDWRQIEAVLRSEFEGAQSFVVKDPRLCLTLPIWLPALRAIGVAVRVLIVVRHPAEVVRSLAARNQLDESNTAAHWLHHMLEAERASRGLDRAVVFYDDLLRDWRGCIARAGQSACITWPRPIQQAAADIDGFLVGSARNHTAMQVQAAVGPSPVREMINIAWLALRHLSTHPKSVDALVCLDQVWAQFAIWRRDDRPPGSRG